MFSDISNSWFQRFSNPAAMVLCSKFGWITDSSDQRRVWTTNFLLPMELPNPMSIGLKTWKHYHYVRYLFRITSAVYIIYIYFILYNIIYIYIILHITYIYHIELPMFWEKNNKNLNENLMNIYNYNYNIYT